MGVTWEFSARAKFVGSPSGHPDRHCGPVRSGTDVVRALAIFRSVRAAPRWTQQGPHGECLGRVCDSLDESLDSGAAQGTQPHVAAQGDTEASQGLPQKGLLRWLLPSAQVEHPCGCRGYSHCDQASFGYLAADCPTGGEKAGGNLDSDVEHQHRDHYLERLGIGFRGRGWNPAEADVQQNATHVHGGNVQRNVPPADPVALVVARPHDALPLRAGAPTAGGESTSKGSMRGVPAALIPATNDSLPSSPNEMTFCAGFRSDVPQAPYHVRAPAAVRPDRSGPAGTADQMSMTR